MFQIFEKYPFLTAGISEKPDGSMKYWNGANEETIKENRKKFLGKLGINNENVVSAEIVHGNEVAIVGNGDKNKIISGVDGLITSEKGVFLSVTVADCLPIYFFDPENKKVGIAHAGWRGLEKNIISNTVEKFREIGSDPKNILSGIGPGISLNNYEIGEEVAEKFKNYAGAVIRDKKKIFLDIKKVAKIQLEAAGIKPQNLEISPECTFSNTQKYFSYRRDKPQKIEAMMGVIGIKG